MKHGLIEAIKEDKGSFRLTEDGRNVSQELNGEMPDDDGEENGTEETAQLHPHPSKLVMHAVQRGQHMGYLSEDGACVTQKDRAMVSFKEGMLHPPHTRMRIYVARISLIDHTSTMFVC
jgi:hypothetical protein